MATAPVIIEQLSRAALERLQQFPETGDRHNWMLRVLGGVKSKLTSEQAYRFLTTVRDRGGMGDFPDCEIQGIVDYCYGVEDSSRTFQKAAKWPAKSIDTISRVLERVEPCFDVAGGEVVEAWQALQALFHPQDLVCQGREVYTAEVRPLKDWELEAAGVQFVVPNPMRAASSTRKDGKASVRCQANVMRRRYLVAEFDDPGLTKSDQAKLHTALSTVCDLVMAVDSGGKSVHGWFRVEPLNDRELAQFFCKCCILGADPAMWNPAQWCRMPGGLRRDGEGRSVRQRILYLNPERRPVA